MFCFTKVNPCCFVSKLTLVFFSFLTEFTIERFNFAKYFVVLIWQPRKNGASVERDVTAINHRKTSVLIKTRIYFNKRVILFMF